MLPSVDELVKLLATAEVVKFIWVWDACASMPSVIIDALLPLYGGLNIFARHCAVSHFVRTSPPRAWQGEVLSEAPFKGQN